MNKKIALLLMGIITLILISSNAVSAAPSLTADVNSTTVAKGETAIVTVAVSEPVGAVSFSLVYDRNVVNVRGKLGNGVPSVPLPIFEDASMGGIQQITVISLSVTGMSGNVVTLEIKGNNTGATVVNVTNVTFYEASSLLPLGNGNDITINVTVVDPKEASYPQTQLEGLRMVDQTNSGFLKVDDQIFVFDQNFDGNRAISSPFTFNSVSGTLLEKASFVLDNCSGTGIRSLYWNMPYPYVGLGGSALRIENCRPAGFIRDTDNNLVYTDGTGGILLVPGQRYNVTMEYDKNNLSIYVINASGGKTLSSRVAGTGKGIGVLPTAKIEVGGWLSGNDPARFEGEILSLEFGEIPSTQTMSFSSPTPIFTGNTGYFTLPPFNTGTMRVKIDNLKPVASDLAGGFRCLFRQFVYPVPVGYIGGFGGSIEGGKLTAFYFNAANELTYVNGAGGYPLIADQTYNVMFEYGGDFLSIYTIDALGIKTLYDRAAAKGAIGAIPTRVEVGKWVSGDNPGPYAGSFTGIEFSKI